VRKPEPSARCLSEQPENASPNLLVGPHRD
jgi:hypothetical protein